MPPARESKTLNEMATSDSLFLLWLILAGVPYVLLSSHPFSSRYGYPAAFGFSLLLVAVPYFFVGGSSYQEIFWTFCSFPYDRMHPWQAAGRENNLWSDRGLTEVLVADLSKRNIQDSQIVVAGRALKFWGLLRYGPGQRFLKYYLKRDDLTGLVGLPIAFYDPFNKWKNDWDDRMSGISVDKPTFVYGFDIGTKNWFKKIPYCSGPPSGGLPGTYFVGSRIGKISLYCSVWNGAIFRQSREMERMGITRNDIFGGQECSHSKFGGTSWM